MNWFSQLFCKHQWITKFRGTFTRGVECSICHKAELLVELNDGSEPVGWLEDH